MNQHEDAETIAQEVLAEQNVPVEGHPYVMRNGQTGKVIVREDGSVEYVQLAHFEARITKEVLVHNGLDQPEIKLEIVGISHFTEMPPRWITAKEFDQGTIFMTIWGVKAIVEPEVWKRTEFRNAIQHLSHPVRITQYGHLGWTVFGGQHVYIDALGGIGPNGRISGVQTDIHIALKRYCFPEVVKPVADPLEVRRALEFIDVAPDHISMTILALVFRCLLNQCPLTLYLKGQTGTKKTTLAALALNFIGDFSAKDHFRFGATPNALFAALFVAKDSLVLIDDFKLGAEADEKSAAIVLQAQGDGGGRHRAKVDGSLSIQRGSRATVIATGEDIPAGGASTLARTLVVPISKTDVDGANLTRVQGYAAQGLLRSVGGSYMCWLARNRDRMLEAYKDRVAILRNSFARLAPSAHPRSPEQAAELYFGFEMLRDFMLECGAVDAQAADALDIRMTEALRLLLTEQESLAEEFDPVAWVQEVTQEAIVTRKLKICDYTGRDIIDGLATDSHICESFGQVVSGAGEVLVLPHVWEKFYSSEARRIGLNRPITMNMLLKRLSEMKVVAMNQGGRARSRRVFQSGNTPGQCVTVVVIEAAWLLPPELLASVLTTGSGVFPKST